MSRPRRRLDSGAGRGSRQDCEDGSGPRRRMNFSQAFSFWSKRIISPGRHKRSLAKTGLDARQRQRAEASDRRGSKGQRAEAHDRGQERPGPWLADLHRQRATRTDRPPRPPGQSLIRTDRAGWGEEQGTGWRAGERRGRRRDGCPAPRATRLPLAQRAGARHGGGGAPRAPPAGPLGSTHALGLNRPRSICSATRAAWAAVVKMVPSLTPWSGSGTGLGGRTAARLVQAVRPAGAAGEPGAAASDAPPSSYRLRARAAAAAARRRSSALGSTNVAGWGVGVRLRLRLHGGRRLHRCGGRGDLDRCLLETHDPLRDGRGHLDRPGELVGRRRPRQRSRR